jgi:hypothetical protein
MKAQRITIGRNDDLLRNAHNEAKERNRIIAVVNLFFQQYKLQPLHPKDFEGVNIVELFATRYLKANVDAYPKHFAPMEAVKSAEIDLTALRSEQTKWSKLRLPFDYETLTAPKDLDVNIYATTEREIERFKHAKTLSDALNVFYAECGRPWVNNQHLKQLTGGAVIVDQQTLQIAPNPNWVQGLFI